MDVAPAADPEAAIKASENCGASNANALRTTDLAALDINDNVRFSDLQGTGDVSPVITGRDFVIATVAAPTKGAEPVVDPNAPAAAAPAAKGKAPPKAAAPAKGAAPAAAAKAPAKPAAKK